MDGNRDCDIKLASVSYTDAHGDPYTHNLLTIGYVDPYAEALSYAVANCHGDGPITIGYPDADGYRRTVTYPNAEAVYHAHGAVAYPYAERNAIADRYTPTLDGTHVLRRPERFGHQQRNPGSAL